MCCKSHPQIFTGEIPQDLPLMGPFCCMTRRAYEFRRGVAKALGFTQDITPWGDLTQGQQDDLTGVGRAYYFDLREPETAFDKVFAVAIKVMNERKVSSV